MISYPSGQVTPNQARRLVEGDEPFIAYRGWDGDITFHLMGPLSPIIGVQEGVTITADSIKGLFPTWNTLDQSGANQDGVTFNDAVYNPIEIDMVVEAHGRTPESTRQVIRDWVASWDARQTGELSIFTRESGMWWADVRWLRSPTDALMRASSCRQRFVWTCRVDDAFWRSFDSVSKFTFAYEDMTDTFNYQTNVPGNPGTGLGPNWPLRYFGSGGGFIYATGSQAAWKDEGLFGTQAREVVCGPYRNFFTQTNNTVTNMVLGSIPELSLPTGAFNDVWGRMGRDGSGNWDGYGIRARIGPGYIELAHFKGFSGGNPIKKIMTSRPLIIQPLFGEKFTLICGVEGNERMFRVMRNDVIVLEHVENDSNLSAVGSAYRGIGFGMYAAGALITQATPGAVRKISSGDNRTVAQAGWLPLTNIGDVEAWPRFLLYGPGKFFIGNGPLNTDTVEFGPLLPGQVVLIETEPRRRSVVDLSPSQQPDRITNPFERLVSALISFALNNNVPPFLQQFENTLGVLPPQVNLYSLLNGRFTRPVPAKPAGSLGSTNPIRVRIDDGNAQSKIVAALTPRRRWPL